MLKLNQANVVPKTSYMAELETWIELCVEKPLFAAWNDPRGTQETTTVAVETVRKSIKAKILESYRNGQAAGPRREFKRR